MQRCTGSSQRRNSKNARNSCAGQLKAHVLDVRPKMRPLRVPVNSSADPISDVHARVRVAPTRQHEVRGGDARLKSENDRCNACGQLRFFPPISAFKRNPAFNWTVLENHAFEVKTIL